jgi:hypothetical protein
MFSWRITKYNPCNRDINGIYTIQDEWTSYSDIGTVREGKIFTYEDYKKVEDAYIASILMIMECNAVQKLKVVGLEKRGPLTSDSYISEDMKEIYDKVRDGIYCPQGTIDGVARLVLREKLWCKFEARSMFVHFGYDYYMYIKSAQMCEKEVEKIQEMGLYVEEQESPYND